MDDLYNKMSSKRPGKEQTINATLLLRSTWLWSHTLPTPLCFFFYFFIIRTELSMLFFCAQYKTSRLAKTLPRRYCIHLKLDFSSLSAKRMILLVRLYKICLSHQLFDQSCSLAIERNRHVVT